MRTDRRHSATIGGTLLLGLLLCISAAPAVSQTARVVDEFQPGVKWGGRTVAVSVNAPSNSVIIATESGGLFRSLHNGDSWVHLDGLPPFRTFDVKYGPSGSGVVLATTMRDSHTVNGGGIWRSTDGGDHWQRPATVDPPAGAQCPPRASAHGITFQPESNNVYVGTDCGLAISRDLGATWTHVVPDSANPRFWSVAASGSGTVYICGDGGARLSQDQGATWSPPFQNVGACMLGAVHGMDFSPEAQTVFAIAASGRLFRCDAAGGGCLDMQAPALVGGQRVPMTRVSPATAPANSVDVYFGAQAEVERQTCLIQPPLLRCPANWTGPLITDVNGDAHHSDVNDLAFGAGRCQLFATTDGGVARSADCGSTWSNVGTNPAGLHALGLYDVAGQIHPDHTDLYIGTQDNGLWPSGSDGGLTWPAPPAPPFDQEGGGFQLERRCTDHGCRLLVWIQTGGVVSTNAHFAANLPWNGPPGNPQGCTPTIISRRVYVQFSPSPFGPGSTLYLTTDDGRSWNPVVMIGQTLAGCPQVSGPPDNPTLYQPILLPGLTRKGDPVASLLRITGILPAGGAASVSRAGATLHSLGQYCMGQGVWPVGCPFVFGASRTDPLRLIAPDVDTGEMKRSTDGGATWTADPALTALVTAQGTFQFNFGNGDPGTRMQVHAIAFDPDNGSHIMIGTEAAGLFESFDNGASWKAIASSNRVTAVSGFFFKDDNSVVVATYGRGLWLVHDCGQRCNDDYSVCLDNCIADFESCPVETPRVSCVQAYKACVKTCKDQKAQCLATCK
jgi:photosystem II stability/assembly factor-like uncharacterized protein